MCELTVFRGRRACTCQAQWIPAFEAELIRRGLIKQSVDIAQLIGGAPQSGGTHTGGGAIDIWQSSWGVLRCARDMGADASWGRTRAQGFSPHAHLVLRGCPRNSPARYQITSTYAGVDHNRNGLANGAPDDGPRPLSGLTWQQGLQRYGEDDDMKPDEREALMQIRDYLGARGGINTKTKDSIGYKLDQTQKAVGKLQIETQNIKGLVTDVHRFLGAANATKVIKTSAQTIGGMIAALTKTTEKK